MLTKFSVYFMPIEVRLKRIPEDWGSSGIKDIAVKISLENTELRSATPFMLIEDF